VSRQTDAHPAYLRPWVAILGGAVAGIALATAVILVWAYIGPVPDDAGHAASRPDTLVDVFRLPPGAAFEMIVTPAGPDARGEPALSAGLFPGEAPARELASVLVANTGARGDWDVDLVALPLRAHCDEAESFEMAAVDASVVDALPPQLALRFRGLGGRAGPSTVAPGTLRRFLLALPPGRTFSEVSVVQWGDQQLARARIDVEHLHAFRERPADVPPAR